MRGLRSIIHIMKDWIKDEKNIYTWMPTLIWAVIILFFSILPFPENIPVTVGSFDKMAHFFEYTLLGVLIVRAMYRSGILLKLKSILFALILSSVYGIVMELLQFFASGREPSVYDVVANISGAVFGLIIGRILLWQK